MSEIDIETELAWKAVLKDLSQTFDGIEEVKDVIFLIGIQELGQGPKKFTKSQKIDLMHIGICEILIPYGYYEYMGRDEDGWPHYKAIESLPALSENEKEMLLKRAVVGYFESRGD